nr:FHA domain-containing protein [Anaerolineae bacterium]
MVDRKPNSQTDRLDGDKLLDTTFVEPEVVYQPVPNPKITIDDRQGKPVWRVRFDLAFNPSVRFGLDINDEIILGRGSDLPNIYDLSQYDAAQLGVSRHHLRIRPTDTALYIVDTGSTNGTLRNGQLVGVNTPYSLVNGDIITLGKLQLILRLVYRPTQTSSLEKKADLADALTRVAQAITSQLELDEVMNRVAEAAMMVTSAKEAGIWLIDQESGELFLEAQRGIDDERIR